MGWSTAEQVLNNSGNSCYTFVYSNVTIVRELLDLHESKQGNTTNLNISFSMESEKRAAQVGFKPMTYVLLTRQMLYPLHDHAQAFFDVNYASQ